MAIAILDQALLQSNAQIAGNDLDDVFGLQRRRPRRTGRVPAPIFAAGPRVAAIRRKVASTSSTFSPCPSRVRGAIRRRLRPVAVTSISSIHPSSSLPDDSATIRNSDRPPTCRVDSFHAGNARPGRNIADTAASSTVRDFKYSASPGLQQFLRRPAIASQAADNRSVDCSRLWPICSSASDRLRGGLSPRVAVT